MFKAVKSAAVSLALLSSMSAAFSHPAVVLPLPTHHATLLAARLAPSLVPAHSSASFTALQLNALLKKGSGNFFLNPSASALSGSQKALYSSLKLTAGTSINSSINLSNLSSGQFFATQYLPSGPVLANSGLTFRAFGNNPLNSTVTPTGPVSTTLQTIFINASHPALIGTSTSALLLGKSLQAAPESAATRRIASIYGAVASKGAQLGTFISSHPTGGVLYGSFYTPTGSSLTYTANIALAFGNNAFNNASTTSIPYLANGSFIQFGSKIFRTVSSGQFFGTEYFATSATVPNPITSNGQFLYVFGANNPLNVAGHIPILASAFPSFFKF